MSITILAGDCRDVLPTLPAGSVQCCVTSPPYFGLRSYLPAEHDLKRRELGSGQDLPSYVAAIVGVFREVRRVLRDDGTVWLNLGDSYAGSWGSQGREYSGLGIAAKSARQVAASQRKASGTGRIHAPGLKPKDLMMVPARVAMALQDDGWWLRSQIVWAKPNPMPESIADRPTSSYEVVYLLSKASRYFYDPEAIRERHATPAHLRGRKHGKQALKGQEQVRPRGNLEACADPAARYYSPGGRNARNVWTIATTPSGEEHFATMPLELAERCIHAGTSAGGCCPSCGAPRRRLVSKGAPDLAAQRAAGGDAQGAYRGRARKGFEAAGVQNASDVKRRILAGMKQRHTTGWEPGCTCADPRPPVPCTVLDPFGGVGTTGLAADRLQRNAVLVELHPDHAGAARRRITAESPLFAAAD